jgi:hypothetical protein
MFIEVEWIDRHGCREPRTVGDGDRLAILRIIPMGGEHLVTAASNGHCIMALQTPEAAQAFADGLLVRHEPGALAPREQTTNNRTSPRTWRDRIYKP